MKDHQMSKIIIRYDDEVGLLSAIDYARVVITQGRISKDEKQFCYHTSFKYNVAVSAFKPSEKTDTLVVYKEVSL